MSGADAVIVAVTAVVSLWLGRRATVLARFVLWASVLLVSAAMFMPSTRLREWAGPGLMDAATAALRPWVIGDVSHFIAFAWLGMVLWSFRPDLRGWRLLAILAALAVLGEVVQGALTIERSAHIGDVAINMSGAALGLVIAIGISRFAKAIDSRSERRKT